MAKDFGEIKCVGLRHFWVLKKLISERVPQGDFRESERDRNKETIIPGHGSQSVSVLMEAAKDLLSS